MKRLTKLAIEVCPKLSYIKPQEAPLDELVTAFEAGYLRALEDAADEAVKWQNNWNEHQSALSNAAKRIRALAD